jgi:hypothetical protein
MINAGVGGPAVPLSMVFGTTMPSTKPMAEKRDEEQDVSRNPVEEPDDAAYKIALAGSSAVTGLDLRHGGAECRRCDKKTLPAA